MPQLCPQHNCSEPASAPRVTAGTRPGSTPRIHEPPPRDPSWLLPPPPRPAPQCTTAQLPFCSSRGGQSRGEAQGDSPSSRRQGWSCLRASSQTLYPGPTPKSPHLPPPPHPGTPPKATPPQKEASSGLRYQGAATLATKVTARYLNTFLCLTEHRKNVTTRIFIIPSARLFSLLISLLSRAQPPQVHLAR